MRVFGCILGTLIFLVFSGVSSAGEYCIIISKKAGIRSVTTNELRNLFLGKVNELQGKKLIPVNLSFSDPLRKKFDDNVIGMSYVDQERYWIAEKLAGGRKKPVNFNMYELIVKLVEAKGNYIGYVDCDVVKNNDRVFVVKVQ